MSKTNKEFNIFVFRAIDEPELCQQYLEGHISVLKDYGITNVSTNNSKWINHPYIYCAMAQDNADKSFVGGVRIQISDGVHPLPVESAIGDMDETIYDKVKEYALKGGISESCGLWTAKSVKGIGIARYLMRASIASSNQLGFNKMLGICGWHTMKLFNQIGFLVDKSLGENGDFPYPTKEHIANVIGILDAVTLKNAIKEEQEIMLNIRNSDTFFQNESTDKYNIEVNYSVKYPKIMNVPLLNEENYCIESLKNYNIQ